MNPYQRHLKVHKTYIKKLNPEDALVAPWNICGPGIIYNNISQLNQEFLQDRSANCK